MNSPLGKYGDLECERRLDRWEYDQQGASTVLVQGRPAQTFSRSLAGAMALHAFFAWLGEPA